MTMSGMHWMQVEERLGDGNFAGRYVRPDEDMVALWSTAVSETRELLESGWDGSAAGAAHRPPAHSRWRPR